MKQRWSKNVAKIKPKIQKSADKFSVDCDTCFEREMVQGMAWNWIRQAVFISFIWQEDNIEESAWLRKSHHCEGAQQGQWLGHISDISGISMHINSIQVSGTPQVLWLLWIKFSWQLFLSFSAGFTSAAPDNTYCLNAVAVWLRFRGFDAHHLPQIQLPLKHTRALPH